MYNVVLDTNILVSALWSVNSNPSVVVEKVIMNEIVPYFDTEIVDEYYEVLLRAKLGFHKEMVSGLLSEIMKNGVFAESVVSDVIFTDESDRKFYDLAKTNDAFLITGNLKHYPKEPFIVSPLAFLQKF